MSERFAPLSQFLPSEPPAAQARLQGDRAHPDVHGEVLFYPYRGGTLLFARVSGLPGDGFFGFHIHEYGDCCTGGDVPFYCAGGHYNPDSAVHPYHAGDLPVLLSNAGQALAAVYTGRFSPPDVLGRSVVLHGHPDDYHSQPAGDSGERIACGVIEAY